MEAHASALGGIANSHQRCSNSAIPQPKLPFVSLIAATSPHTLSQLLFQLRCRGKEEASPHGLSDSMISASLQWGKGSGGSLSRRRQRWKLTHQLWVESQTRIKDAQTVRFRSQSCHLFRLSLQRLLTRSRSCYFSFAAGGYFPKFSMVEIMPVLSLARNR